MSLIVFDLDGTLVDSRLDLVESVNAMLETYGARPLPIDVVTPMIGEGAKVLVERALGETGLDSFDPDALTRFLEIYGRRLLVHTRPYPGIAEVVSHLGASHALAVLTNKPETPTRRLLDAFDLTRYFSRIVGGDSQFARKPDPAGLSALMLEFSASPAETWLVGDSMIDVETARRAGVRMCVALYGFGQLRGELRLDPTERTVTSAAEIPAAIGGAPIWS